MYAWYWRNLPGPTWRRVVLSVVLVGLVVVVLFGWVFPWLEPRMPFNDVTVQNGAGPPVPLPGSPLASAMMTR
jgi:hypothetical protein